MKNNLLFLKKYKGVLSIIVLICHLWSVLEGEPKARFLVNYISNAHSQKLAFYVDRFFVEIGGVAVWYFLIITGIGIRMSMEGKDNISYKDIFLRYKKLMIPVVFVSFVSFILMKMRLFACYFNNNTCLSEWTIGKNAFEPKFFDMIEISVFRMWFTNEVNGYNTFTWCMFTFLWGGYVCYAIWGISHSWETKHIVIGLIFLLFLFRDNNIVLCIGGYLMAELYCSVNNVPLSKYVPGNICVIIVFLFTLSASIMTCSSHIRELLIIISSSIIIFNADFFEQILSGKIFEFFGRISYEVYLVQYVILFTLTSYIYQSLYSSGALFSEVISSIITIPIVLICATLLSSIIKCFSTIYTKNRNVLHHS